MTFPIEVVLPILEREVRSYKLPVVDAIAIQTHDPFKVLVTTLLSARTRDEVTESASHRLFVRAGTVGKLAQLTVDEIEQLIYPVSFFRNKARYLNRLPVVLYEQFGGIVPRDIPSLLKLPGVGPKTANLILVIAFNIPAICVDTHVHRIMNIWGYVETATPSQTERTLRQKLPKKYWLRFNSILVAFGQGTCRPVSPHCDCCVISDICPKIDVIPRKQQQGQTGKPVKKETD